MTQTAKIMDTTDSPCPTSILPDKMRKNIDSFLRLNNVFLRDIEQKKNPRYNYNFESSEYTKTKQELFQLLDTSLKIYARACKDKDTIVCQFIHTFLECFQQITQEIAKINNLEIIPQKSKEQLAQLTAKLIALSIPNAAVMRAHQNNLTYSEKLEPLITTLSAIGSAVAGIVIGCIIGAGAGLIAGGILGIAAILFVGETMNKSDPFNNPVVAKSGEIFSTLVPQCAMLGMYIGSAIGGALLGLCLGELAYTKSKATFFREKPSAISNTNKIVNSSMFKCRLKA